jgi:hypothetical protein
MLQFHQCAPVGEPGHFQSPEARYSFSITPMGFLDKFAIYDLLYQVYWTRDELAGLTAKLRFMELLIKAINHFFSFVQIRNISSNPGFLPPDKCTG